MRANGMIEIPLVEKDRNERAFELLKEFYMSKQDESDCECDGSMMGCWFCRVAHLFEH